jgi:hypothetical protein
MGAMLMTGKNSIMGWACTVLIQDRTILALRDRSWIPVTVMVPLRVMTEEQEESVAFAVKFAITTVPLCPIRAESGPPQ